MPHALIAGISGQDGQLLGGLLMKKGYRVWGVARRPLEVQKGIELLVGDIAAPAFVDQAVRQVRPDEVYNLAAISRVMQSYREPLETIRVNAQSPVLWLDALRRLRPQCRFFQAGSSEIFGEASVSPQNEETPLRPRNPYGAAKAHAHALVRAYRAEYDLFACNGILYNHESELRPEAFVTRKITAAAARIKAGGDEKLHLGDLTARRDWSHAADFVWGMWAMLQHRAADDYVLASGRTHSVEDFCRLAFEHVGLDWRSHTVVDEGLVRSEKGAPLCGDAARARRQLGWRPRISFEELVRCMVEADCAVG